MSHSAMKKALQQDLDDDYYPLLNDSPALNTGYASPFHKLLPRRTSGNVYIILWQTKNKKNKKKYEKRINKKIKKSTKKQKTVKKTQFFEKKNKWMTQSNQKKIKIK